MKTKLIKAESRGHIDYGWLKSSHSFSFGSYYNPDQMGFGMLRVINDDLVAPSRGFETHGHRDMEIVSIPLSGSLKHKDSEGHTSVIGPGEVQVMSAGTGVLHSEFNASDSDPVSFLQIWILPDKKRIKPRYDQRKFDVDTELNTWHNVVSPIATPNDGIKINQQVWFSICNLSTEKSVSYEIKKPGNGIYLFLIDGSVSVEKNDLNARDSLEVTNTEKINIQAKHHAKVLIIETPI